MVKEIVKNKKMRSRGHQKEEGSTERRWLPSGRAAATTAPPARDEIRRDGVWCGG
jgi:hypothetical protein